MVNSGTESDDRRRDVRRRAVFFGTLRLSNGTSIMDCRIRNISDGGARLELATAGWLDRTFDIVIGSEKKRKRAEIIWRSAEAAGVRFHDEAAGIPDLENELVQLRSEVQELMQRLEVLTARPRTQ